MSEDTRCCGTGTCIINADGVCWCGQQWDGEKMCFSKRETPTGLNGLTTDTAFEKQSASFSGKNVHNG